MLDKQTAKEIALSCGFKLKEQANGEMDLNPYVYDTINKAIEVYESKKNGGWISVDNELPKTFTNVLVYSKLKINDETFDCIGIGYIDDENYWQYDESFGYHHCDPYFIKEISSNDLTDVQYWQPLPQPPKE